MTNAQSRHIKTEEKELIQFILNHSNEFELLSQIPENVYDLDDGGMGSIKFTNKPERVYGRDVLEVNYTDADATQVVIALTIDNKGELFELDFWKVNFEKLNKYPKPNEIELI